jgi:hypothetical protein
VPVEPIDYEKFEFERHRAEVRQVIRWRIEDRDRAHRYLDAVEQKRRHGGGAKLRKDVMEQWKLGNRGADGDWRSAESTGKDNSEIFSARDDQSTS